MKISVVTTLYKSSKYIYEFHERISKAVTKITNDYEIIYVNDGSPDDSLELAINLHKKDNKVVVVDLSRNYQHHKAVMTGLSIATGDYVFMINIDLEENPETLNLFWDEIRKSDDIDVVYGITKKRKGNLNERLSGRLFYKLFDFLSDVKIPKNYTFCRLAKRNYIDALLQYREKELMIAGVWYDAGFNQVPITIEVKAKGSTSYSLRKKINLSINSITSFSNKPLYYIFLLGLLISGLSFVFIVTILLRYFFYGVAIEGWTSLIASLWFIGGVIIFCVGLLGLYLSKIFIETKQRPYTLVKNIYKNNGNKT